MLLFKYFFNKTNICLLINILFNVKIYNTLIYTIYYGLLSAKECHTELNVGDIIKIKYNKHSGGANEEPGELVTKTVK